MIIIYYYYDFHPLHLFQTTHFLFFHPLINQFTNNNLHYLLPSFPFPTTPTIMESMNYQSLIHQQ